MNRNFKKIMKNFGFTLGANIITLVVSIIVTLIVPKVVGVEQFGYFQLYLFYASYLGFLQFGWNDGLYLKIGGEKYSELNKKSLFSQFWILAASQVFISINLIIFSRLSNMEGNKRFIFFILGLTLISIGTRAMLLFVFQATNRFAEFSRIMILDRLIYISLITLSLSIGIDDFRYIIVADLMGKVITLLYVMYLARDIVFMSPKFFVLEGKEIYDNIRVGISLMFANIAGMLILGIVRFGVEKVWNIVIFGKVSLILSISMMLMVFVNAMSAVMFPVLRRSPTNSLPHVYVSLRNMLMPILLGLLLLYFPLKILLGFWLPNYSDSINYMFLIFPVIIFEGKMSFLINTYLKTLRYEKLMLRVNLIGVAISLLLTIIAAFWLENLYLTMLTISLVLATRSIIAEILVGKVLKIQLLSDIKYEIILTLIFILSVWFLPSMLALISYLITYMFYIFRKKNDFSMLKQTLNRVVLKGRVE